MLMIIVPKHLHNYYKMLAGFIPKGEFRYQYKDYYICTGCASIHCYKSFNNMTTREEFSTVEECLYYIDEK